METVLIIKLWWSGYHMLFLTSKVIYLSKKFSLENRPVHLSFPHGVIIVVALTGGPCSHPPFTPREISDV